MQDSSGAGFDVFTRPAPMARPIWLRCRNAGEGRRRSARTANRFLYPIPSSRKSCG